MHKFKDINHRVTGWALALAEFDPIINYQPGKTIPHVDALSRHPIHDNTTELEFRDEDQIKKILTKYHEDCIRDLDKPYIGPLPSSVKRTMHLQVNMIDQVQLLEEIRHKQIGDSEIIELKELIGKKSSWGGIYYIKDEILHRKWINTKPPQRVYHQLVIPKVLRSRIISSMHDSLVAGHLGFTKTFQNVRKRFYWPGMKSDIDYWISSCETCASAMNPNSKKLGKLMPLPVPLQAGHTISMDIIGPLKITKQGYRYILVIIDHLSKWLELIPLTTLDAKVVSQAFVDNWICRHGVPMKIITDRANYFVKACLPLICKLMKIKQLGTTAYHPQSDGQTERAIKFVMEILRKIIGINHDRWDEKLQMIALIIRTNVHSSTNFTPFQLTYGREARLPIDSIMDNTNPLPFEINDEYVASLMDSFEQIRDQAKKSIELAKARNAQYYNQSKNFKNPISLYPLIRRNKTG